VSAPHPLAERLIERLQSRPQSRVLDFASGRGRNLEALRRAGLVVVSVSDAAAGSDAPLRDMGERFTAILSTHGFLHGTASGVAARVASIAERLDGGGLFYATFGSKSDARFGDGRRIDDSTFAPTEGDERGVAHAYFDRSGLRALLDQHFQVESLAERFVDEIAGSWAHRERRLAGAVHWFAIASKR
jgi:hypothetical protein